MLTDTHIHLYSEEFDSDRDLLIGQAVAAGITRFLLPNIDSGTLPGLMHLCQQYPGKCFPMAGLHPCSVKEDYENQLKAIKKFLDDNRTSIVAIGETGLDFYWDLTFREQQEKAFRTQVQWAIDTSLPIVIHSRNSTNELIEILKETGSGRLKGVFHCFSGTREQAEEIISLGFYLGLGGVATFKNSGMDKLIPHLPLDRILLETDAPYLAPVPHRGKRNEPAYLKLIADKVAAIKEITFEELEVSAKYNTEKLFRLN